MIKKSIAVTLIFAVSTAIQLISQIVVTRLFGASFELDVFLAAVAIPTVIVTVIYGTLNDILLPIFGEKKAHDPKQFGAFFSIFAIRLTVLASIFALLFMLLSHPIASLLYSSRGERFVDGVSLQMACMSLSFPSSVLATVCGSYFYIHKRYLRFPIAQLIGSAINVLIIVGLVHTLGIWSLVIAFIVNIFFQIIFVIPQGFHLKNANLLLTKEQGRIVTSMLFAWIPLMIGYFALRSDTVLIRSFGSLLPPGSLVHLNLIFKVFSLATSVMTIGFQIVLLPQLIEDFNKKNYEKASADVRNTKFITIAISCLIVGLAVILAPFFIKILFIGGRFSPEDANSTLSYIPFFILPSIAWGINNTFFQPLIALKKQKELGILNIASFAMAWVAGLIVNGRLGPQYAIMASLITLLFTGIIGSEILWQRYKKALPN